MSMRQSPLPPNIRQILSEKSTDELAADYICVMGWECEDGAPAVGLMLAREDGTMLANLFTDRDTCEMYGYALLEAAKAVFGDDGSKPKKNS